MEIFELASELGKKLAQDERLVALEQAKNAYEENKELQTYLVEYDVQQRAMQKAVTQDDRDMDLIESIQRRINELYELIANHPAFEELNRAQAVVNELMNSVNQTIMTQITGEEPSGCTHNCSTCGGCH
ncbi:MAG: YlbF family regulator [Clostridia bacterium]|nr:YlbF family regulator [Clostridia bacterium]